MLQRMVVCAWRVVWCGVVCSAKSPQSLPFVELSTFPQFFGQAVFLFAIHIVILPIAQSMREPKQFKSVADWWVWRCTATALGSVAGSAHVMRCIALRCVALGIAGHSRLLW
jgi:hypothetical protein